MMSSGSTTFFFDFDIFSIAPISTGAPVKVSFALRVLPSVSTVTSAGSTKTLPTR